MRVALQWLQWLLPWRGLPPRRSRTAHLPLPPPLQTAPAASWPACAPWPTCPILPPAPCPRACRPRLPRAGPPARPGPPVRRPQHAAGGRWRQGTGRGVSPTSPPFPLAPPAEGRAPPPPPFPVAPTLLPAFPSCLLARVPPPPRAVTSPQPMHALAPQTLGLGSTLKTHWV